MGNINIMLVVVVGVKEGAQILSKVDCFRHKVKKINNRPPVHRLRHQFASN